MGFNQILLYICCSNWCVVLALVTSIVMYTPTQVCLCVHMISTLVMTRCGRNTVNGLELGKNVWYDKKCDCLHDMKLNCAMPLFLLVYGENQLKLWSWSHTQGWSPIVQTYHIHVTIKLDLSTVNNGY